MFKEMRVAPSLVFLSIVFFFFYKGLPAVAQGRPQSAVPARITAPIDNAARVTVAGSTHPMALARFDRGPVDSSAPMQRMILVLGASVEQEHQLRAYLDSQQTEGSPDYHHWLTPEEFGQRFGPAPQDIQQVTGWLQQQGFSVGSVAKSGRWIEFSGTAAQVNQAFQTQMRNYQVEGKLHTANATDITIPAALAPVVKGVASLHDFYSKPMLRRSLQHATAALTPGKPGLGRPMITFSDGSHGVAPPDFATIYNLNPLYTATPTNIKGTGQTIAIVAVSNINTMANAGIDDVANFRALFNLPPNTPNIMLNGPDPGVVGGADEASLDVEWAGAIAPNATIDLVVSGGTLTTDPVVLSASFIVDQNLAPIMSVSFGNCEQALGTENSMWNALWEQAAAQGISVFVASGDTGAAGCDPNGGNTTIATGGLGVNGVGSTPFNTAVGGTEFNENGNDATFWNPTNDPTTLGSAIGYIPEEVWNESCTPSVPGSLCQQFNIISLAAGGGGVSTLYSPLPSFQTLNITGLQGAGFTHRVVPDVSLAAAANHDPLVFCFSIPGQPDCQTTVTAAGGTSFSSPSFAGIMALVDQKTNSRQGLANFVLYALGATESSSGFGPCNSSNQTNPKSPNPAFQSCVFPDVTAGNNGVPGNDTLTVASPGNKIGQNGYNAIAGFDLGSGLGSVNATNLVNAWAALAGGFQGSTTTLSASFNGTPLPAAVTITHGQAVSISVSVARMGSTGTPSGDVSLIAQGGNLPSTVGVIGTPITPGASGTATAGPLNVTNLPGGTNYNIVASYPGDGTFGSSASSTISLTVGAEGSTTTLKSEIVNLNTFTFGPGNTVAYGDPVNILVIDAIAAGSSGQGSPSGTTTFTGAGASPIPILLDNSGIAELADCFSPLTACLPPGHYTINASYGGDLSFNTSTGTAVSITVTQGTATVSVSAPATVNPGQQFTLTAQVQGAGLATITPTGTVQFFDGTTSLGSAVTLSGGQASMPVTLNTGGAHSITAKYSGDSTYLAATSPATVVTVNAPFNFTATTTSETIPAGSTATFSVTLNGLGGFTGAVAFTCTGATGGATCAVNPNPANLSATTTSVPVTVTVSNTANARLAPIPFKTLPFVFAGTFAMLLWGVRKKPRRVLLAVLGAALILGVGSCGGGGGGGGQIIKQNTNDVLTVTGTSGSVSNAITLNLTITH